MKSLMDEIQISDETKQLIEQHVANTVAIIISAAAEHITNLQMQEPRNPPATV